MKGAITHKPNGRWYAELHTPNPKTGKRQRTSLGGYRTKVEAQRALDDAASQVDIVTLKLTPAEVNAVWHAMLSLADDVEALGMTADEIATYRRAMEKVRTAGRSH